MSILKGILHHWNKTNSAYDTIHPETEVAQVTDWNNGIVNTLASTALGTLVNTLTSDSLLATMIQKVLTATGVKYSMGQDGYICFGSLFGGLIIQWIYDKQTSDTAVDSYDVNIPIAMNILGISLAGTLDDQTNIVTYSDTTITVRTLQSQLTDRTHRVKRPFFAILVGVA